MRKSEAEDDKGVVSLAPLTLAQSLTGILGISDPDAKKPKHEKAKRKKALPTDAW